MARIPNKTVNQIKRLVSEVISLTNIDEFDCSFEDAPEFWDDEEKRLCDYQGRIINELLSGLEKIFNTSASCKRIKHSYTDSRGRLWVACSECERGGNGSEGDKCAVGWNVRRYNKKGCFSGRALDGQQT